jgi:hypothetical protein
MFKLFRKKRVDAVANPLQDKAAGVVVSKVLWLQNKWACFMDRRVNRLSVRSKKFGLMVFVGLSVLTCVRILIQTFTSPPSVNSFKVGSVRNGKHSTSTGEENISSRIPEQQYKRIVAFHHYMDSLHGSAQGRRVRDSIISCRPGLLDSAKFLEKLYHSQN